MRSMGSGYMRALAAAALLLASAAAAQLTQREWEDEELFVPPYGQSGCWVLFFAGTEFEPPAARLQGPTFVERFERGPVVIPELKRVGGPVFLRTAQSVIVGPRARLIGYQEVGYDNRSLALEAEQQVANLIDIGFHQRVDSLQVECTRPAE